MIEVKNLTKRFGSIEAVSDISFSIEKGEIVAFLGPNGAGKTTTMKILTCFMRPTNGEIKVGDFDIYDDTMNVKRAIGYLPENNPLYLNMRVIDYLKFVGNLKDVKGSDLDKALEKVVTQCGLKNVMYRKIQNLSKGYRQRVGLAQAIINDPPILILDEPTSGLDPNQRIEIRELIKKLGKEKTVILSTHILPEAESTCNRILIIHRGKIVADGKKEQLAKSEKVKIIVQIKGEKDKIEEILKEIEEISLFTLKTTVENIFTYEIECVDDLNVKEKIFFKCAENSLIIYEMKTIEATLEELFKNLTQN